MKGKKKQLFKKFMGLIMSLMIVTSCFSGTSKVAAADYNVSNMQEGFIRGVDISSLYALEQAGAKYSYASGWQADIFDILKDAGVNYVRIRVWVDPYDSSSGKGYGGGNNDLAKAISLGKRATEHGMLSCIDFHYSDFWADPSKQFAPKAWKNYSASQKATAVYNFTYNSLNSILSAGVAVGMVQIGNETQGSMAGMGGLYDGTWNLTTGVGAAMKKGCEAVDAISSKFGLTGDDKILKALHFTDPLTNAEWYAEQVKNAGVNYDVFAVSFYPFWHGNASDLGPMLKRIAKTYNKKVMVAEVSYPYTYTNADGASNNIQSSSDMDYANYSVSTTGQMQAVKDVMSAVSSVNAQSGTWGYGLGAFYWEPAWIPTSSSAWGNYGTGWASSTSGNYELLYNSSVKYFSSSDCGTSWDNMAMFNSSGKALESLQIFKLVGVTGYDKSEISSLINSANALGSSNSALQTAIAEAVVVRDDYYATKLDLKYAIANLRSAIANAGGSSSGGSSSTVSHDWIFGSSNFKNLGTISSTITVDGLALRASSSKTMSIKSGSKSYNGTSYTHYLALGGGGNTSYRSLSFSVSGACTIKVVGNSSGSSTRTLVLANGNGNTLGTMSCTSSTGDYTLNYTGSATTIYIYSSGSGINLYEVSVK